ncbi:MAG: hypothetical protein M1834_008234 [Cirrosporium novae-zelandiae]|nr:MAG: hypothetical protein M1834_008234 [Cirrosporium novae-zelandiae]
MAECAATLFALAGAAITVTNTIHKVVITIRDAPAELMALSNEVTDINMVIQDAKSAYEDGMYMSVTSGPNVFDRGLEVMDKLNYFIKKLTRGNGEEILFVNRVIWVKEKSKVKDFRSNLRDIRLDIISMLSARSLSTVTQIRLDIAEFRHLYNETNIFTRKILNSLSQEPKTAVQNLAVSGLALSGPGYEEQPQVETPIMLRAFKQSKQACPGICSCICHQRTEFRTANRFLGSLFIGYSGHPFTSKKCNEQRCRHRSASGFQVSYFFPYWFVVQRGLSVALAKCSSMGSDYSMSLKVPRMVPSDAKIFTYCFNGNIEGIKALFDQGLASPMDTDSMTGYTLLQHALRRDSNDVCKFLLAIGGTDPYAVNNFGDSAVDKAWGIVLGKRRTPSFTNWLLASLTDPEHLEKRHFTRLHKIVCGLSLKSLTDELQETTSQIDDVDSNHRTALSWAAHQHNASAVQTLLKFGANPDIPGPSGCTPLHYACGGRDADPTNLLTTVKSLATSTSKINFKDNLGRTPLMQAAKQKQDTPKLISILLDASADLNSQSSTGWTALHFAAERNRATVVQHLLDKGADINSRTKSGATPLMEAVKSNSHQSLRILFEFNADATATNKAGESILHIAAKFGGAKTSEILTNAGLKLDIDAKNVEGITPDTILKSREYPCNENEISLFQKMLENIKQQYQHQQQETNKHKCLDIKRNPSPPSSPSSSSSSSSSHYYCPMKAVHHQDEFFDALDMQPGFTIPGEKNLMQVVEY